MLSKIVSWIKSVFTKDNVKRFIHKAELSVVATASTTVLVCADCYCPNNRISFLFIHF